MERTALAVLASVIDPELLQGGSPAHLQASPWRLLHHRSLHTGTKIESDPMTLTVGSIYRRPHTNQTGTLRCDDSRRRRKTEVGEPEVRSQKTEDRTQNRMAGGG